MPAELQTRLLRVLAEGDFYRVGGHHPVHADVRVIAATHQDLERRVREGSFREDLFHRLNVIRLQLPPLRDRVEDIPELAEHFLRTTAQELDMEPKRLSAPALDVFRAFGWPGNVRQLENVCRRVTIMAPSQTIELADLPKELTAEAPVEISHSGDWEVALRRWADNHASTSQVPILDEAVPRFERLMINVALAKTQGRRHDAARLLGWGRNTLTRKIKELGMEP
jgi:two-component system nitrogen regulation response regulator GlnG